MTSYSSRRFLVDMPPTSASLDRAHVRLACAVVYGDEFVRTFVRADRTNDFRGQNRISVDFSSRRAADFASRLSPAVAISGQRIFGVVGGRSPSKVSRVAARRVVARMQRVSSLKGRGRRHGESYSVGRVRLPFTLPSSRHELAISMGQPCDPQPAIIGSGDFNFHPKSGFCGVIHWNKIDVIHVADPLRCGQGRALLTQRFRPAFLSRIPVCSQGRGATI